MPEPVPEADPLQGFLGGQPPLAGAAAAVEQAERHVAHRIEMVEEEELLEDEAEAVPAQRGQLSVGQAGHVLSGHPGHPGARSFQRPEDVQQGGLARAGRPEHGQPLPRADPQVHPGQRGHRR